MCATFSCRLRGLTFRQALAEEEGLLMDMGRSSRAESAIHMLGVFFDLAIIWLDESLTVVDCRLARRWVSVMAPALPARFVLEAHASRMSEFRPGEHLSIHET
jgi:uncharacterized membrane protein (UPF0127 family)